MSKHNKTVIITEAQQIKTYIETNKKIPNSCKLADETIVSPYQISYLLSCLINDNFKENQYALIPLVRYNTTQQKDTINEKVIKDDYKWMIKNFIKYCNENKRVPSYVTTKTSKVKVSFELYLYCISKIVVYYNNHQTLPNYCLFNKQDLSNNSSSGASGKNTPSSSTSTCTNPYNKATGCDAMGQNNSYYCGVSALQKCLYKLGIKNVTQKQLAQVCGTTTAGTSHQGLRTGVAWASKKFNMNLSVQEAYFSDYTLKQLKDVICNPNKTVILHSLYRNKYGHYEFIKSINTNNNTLDIVNSLGTKCNYGCYCGYIETRNYTTQKQYCNGISQKSLIIITKK